jgi:hypothetical protein
MSNFPQHAAVQNHAMHSGEPHHPWPTSRAFKPYLAPEPTKSAIKIRNEHVERVLNAQTLDDAARSNGN